MARQTRRRWGWWDGELLHPNFLFAGRRGWRAYRNYRETQGRLSMSDVVEATISEVKAICRSLVADKAAKRTPVNLMGPPGAGKTQTFEQLAQEIKADYRVFLTATMDPTDLVGIPNNANDLYTEFLPPKDFLALTEACGKLDVDPDVPVVAVFEDLPACHPQVFNTLLRFMQQ